MVAFGILVPLLIGGVFGARLVASLSKLTHESPIAVLHDLVGGGGNSSVHDAVVNLNRINIALYGYGGAGHDGSYLSDSIMVVSIQPRASGPPQVAEISLPRDWDVPINLGTGDAPRIHYAKINEAFADGMDGESKVFGNAPNAGAGVADQTLETLLGLHIDHYIGVDFYAFKDAVDAVGGVDVNVQNSFTDYQYPAGECNGERGSNCGFMTVSFEAGQQHMDGARALIFARSRHAAGPEGSDFARSKRQQLVVAALKQKVVSLGGIGNLPNLISALGDHVITDMSVSDGEALYSLVKNVDPSSVEHVSFDNTNFLYDCGYPYNCGSYYLYAHDNTYASIQSFVNKVFVPSGVLATHVPITFEDGSGHAGAPSLRWSSLMAELGLNTSNGGVARRRPVTEVINNDGPAGSATAAWLADYFGVTVTSPTPVPTPALRAGGVAAASSSAPAGITVVLGTAEEQAFNNRSGTGN